MKRRYISIIVVLLTTVSLVSCEKTDLTEVYNRIEKIEGQDVTTPKLTSIQFLAHDNVESLIVDVNGEIVGDSIVECWSHHMMKNKILTPSIKWEGGATLLLDDVQYKEGQAYDFKRPVKLSIVSADSTKTYIVFMHAFTGLPIMDIVTENRQDINSKEEYLYAAMTLKEDVVTRAPGDVIYQTVNIKGRGNATWNIYPKKPYRLKFDKKVSFFGEKEDKSWVLLANYADKTMMRTQIASYLGKMSQLDFTPSFHFVELILNGTYLGTYQLGEKIKISKNRVNIGDDGILLEMDGYAKDEEDSRYFYVEHMPQPVNVKGPEMEYSDERFAFVKQYMTEADSVLFSDGFKDKDTGWQKYFDMTSFVDWYLISEITKSIDSFWWSSTYMNIKPGGKLKMGPIWDYDHSFGNYIHEGETENPEGFYVGELYWYKRLMEDPVFREAVRTRFDYFYSRRNDILNEINENAEYLKYSAVENNNKWGTLYTFIWNDLTIWGSYLNEVEYMKEWLVKRFDWLNQNI